MVISDFTKCFKDRNTNERFYVSECCVKGDSGIKHLVLIGIDSEKVLEVDEGYEGVTVKPISCITSGDFVEMSLVEFTKNFYEIIFI